MTVSSKWRSAIGAAAATATLAAVPLLGAQPAHAQYPPPPPGLTLSSTVVSPGDPLTFTGTGFASEQTVEARMYSKKTTLGYFTADQQGTVRGTVVIPEKTRPGKHLFMLKARKPTRVLVAKFTVLPRLADTGDNTSPLLLGGSAGMVALGGGGVLLARRFRKH